jgi:hypothetical protein
MELYCTLSVWTMMAGARALYEVHGGIEMLSLTFTTIGSYSSHLSSITPAWMSTGQQHGARA